MAAAYYCAICEPSRQDNAPPARRPGRAAAGGSTGTVVFFREKKMMGADQLQGRENDVELCKLSNGTFCTVQAPVKHEYVTQTEAKNVLTLEVESGETYYVQAASLWA